MDNLEAPWSMRKTFFTSPYFSYVEVKHKCAMSCMYVINYMQKGLKKKDNM